MGFRDLVVSNLIGVLNPWKLDLQLTTGSVHLCVYPGGGWGH